MIWICEGEDGDVWGGHDIDTTTNQQHSHQQHSALLEQDCTQVSTAERITRSTNHWSRPPLGLPSVFMDLSVINTSRCSLLKRNVYREFGERSTVYEQLHCDQTIMSSVHSQQCLLDFTKFDFTHQSILGFSECKQGRICSCTVVLQEMIRMLLRGCASRDDSNDRHTITSSLWIWSVTLGLQIEIVVVN
jgi:hypothetical protein